MMLVKTIQAYYGSVYVTFSTTSYKIDGILLKIPYDEILNVTNILD